MTEVPEEVKMFLVEAYENLDQVEMDMVELEKNPSDNDLLNSIFRCIHTIKGNSGFLAFPKLEEVCHVGETVLDKLRSGELQLSSDLTTSLLNFVDLTRQILNVIESSGAEGEPEIADMKAELSKFLS